MTESESTVPFPKEQANAVSGTGDLSSKAFFAGVGALIAVALVWMYRQPVAEMVRVWKLPDSYYSHGYLVPFISLFYVWRARRTLLKPGLEPNRLGYFLIVGSIFMLLVGDFLGFRVFGHISLVPMLAGLGLLLLGTERTKALWFPIAFLFFMIPIPPSLTSSVALKLKLLATQCAVALASLLTLPVVRDGSFVYFGDDRLLVGEVCGGLRSLIALLALGALMAYISKTKNWARILLFAVSPFIAIISNVFRIFLLCVVGYFWGSRVASGIFHDISGVLIFVVAFALFFLLEGRLRKWAPVSEDKTAKDAAP
jgi:exosortase